MTKWPFSVGGACTVCQFGEGAGEETKAGKYSSGQKFCLPQILLGKTHSIIFSHVHIWTQSDSVHTVLIRIATMCICVATKLPYNLLCLKRLVRISTHSLHNEGIENPYYGT